jgi:hypothetical protein
VWDPKLIPEAKQGSLLGRHVFSVGFVKSYFISKLDAGGVINIGSAPIDTLNVLGYPGHQAVEGYENRAGGTAAKCVCVIDMSLIIHEDYLFGLPHWMLAEHTICFCNIRFPHNTFMATIQLFHHKEDFSNVAHIVKGIPSNTVMIHCTVRGERTSAEVSDKAEVGGMWLWDSMDWR